MADQRYSRRRLLAASGGVVSAAAIAGCTSAPTAEDGDETVDDLDEQAGDADDATDEGAEEPDDQDDDDSGEDGSEDDDQEFVDMTGEATVRVITREGEGGEGSFVFDPAFIRVDAGTTLEWENTDGVFHTVTSTDDIDNRSGGGDEFDETISGEGETFEWTAEETGEQPYYCSPHAGFMFGSIEIV